MAWTTVVGDNKATTASAARHHQWLEKNAAPCTINGRARAGFKP